MGENINVCSCYLKKNKTKRDCLVSSRQQFHCTDGVKLNNDTICSHSLLFFLDKDDDDSNDRDRKDRKDDRKSSKERSSKDKVGCLLCWLLSAC